MEVDEDVGMFLGTLYIQRHVSISSWYPYTISITFTYSIIYREMCV